MFFSTSFLVTHPSVGHLSCLRRMGSVLGGSASAHVEAQNASEAICFYPPVLWWPTRPRVTCCACAEWETHSVAMHRPRMQVAQFVFGSQFSGGPPSAGHLLCLRRMGGILSGNASPHVEAQGASEAACSSQPGFWWPTPPWVTCCACAAWETH